MNYERVLAAAAKGSTDNPARRIIRMLARLIEGGLGDQGYIALSKAFEIDTEGRHEDDWQAETAFAWADFIGLFDRARVYIESVDSLDPEPFTQSIGRLARVAATWSLYDPVEGLLNNLTDGDMANLAGCASMLDRATSLRQVDPVEKVHLADRVQDLITEINDDEELPDDLKRLTLDHLLRIAHVLRRYEVFGAEGLQASILQVWGDIARRPDLAKVLRDEHSPRLRKVIDLLTVASLAIGIPQAALVVGDKLVDPGGELAPVSIEVNIDDLDPHLRAVVESCRDPLLELPAGPASARELGPGDEAHTEEGQ